jgi:hypothetical protein
MNNRNYRDVALPQPDDDEDEEQVDDVQVDEEEASEEGMGDYEFVLQNFVGFDDINERRTVITNTFRTLDQLKQVEEKDIRSMIEELAKRTVANGRVIFGMARTQLMIGLMHWVQDCIRCNNPIDIITIDGEATLMTAIERSKARKQMKDATETQTKTTTPGKFKKESEWYDWYDRFTIFLSVIPGMTGIPLSYVVRENESPDPSIVPNNFMEEMEANAPLTGTTFEVDSAQVHTYLLGFVQGEPAEQWIKHLRRQSNGREDILALKAHYGAEGNVARRLADADRLSQQLHYKSEQAMPFERFLNRAQEMFNIYEENKQPMYNEQKIRWLMGKINNPMLAATIEALKTDRRRNPDLSYVTVANDIATAVNDQKETKLKHNISTIGSNRSHVRGGSHQGRGGGSTGRHSGRSNNNRGGGRGRGRSSGGRSYGEGKLGYISPEDWKKLSYDERTKIREQRDQKGLRGGTKATNEVPANISSTNSTENERMISAITSAVIRATAASQESVTNESQSDMHSNSGSAFGGQNEAKRARFT